MTADKSNNFCSLVDRVIHGYRDSYEILLFNEEMPFFLFSETMQSGVGLPVGLLNSNFLIKVHPEKKVINL